MKTLVMGLGNPFRCDDGVGLRAANVLGRKVDDSEVTVIETNEIGLGILDLLIGYQRVIIIDAIQTEQGNPGQIYRLSLQDLAATHSPSTSHNFDLATIMELGAKLGLVLPREVIVVAVEVADITTFSEECTSEVEKAIPEVVKLVIQELSGPS